MRILRVRHGFQADHSSSSYLFYAVDKPVSAKGQQVAHRFSSRAEVDEHFARYHKWGESELSYEAYKALLTEHYDVMVSESYDWWTLMIAVPKTPEMEARLAPFRDARGYDDQGVEVEDYGRRLVVTIYCSFDYGGPAFEFEEDPLEVLIDRLVETRKEILAGNTAFLQAVASYYGVEEDEEEEEEEARPAEEPLGRPLAGLSKAELQQECTARGIAYRKSWTKSQLQKALTTAAGGRRPAQSTRKEKPARLSRAAREIVESLGEM